MRKKVISVFMMAAFLVMACLAGCGQAGETQEASDSLTPSSQTESTPSTTENETEAVSYTHLTLPTTERV